MTQISEDELDLIVTPEYCMPWNVIKKIVKNEMPVKKHELWALGAESILPNELEAFRVFCETQEVKVLFEQLEQ